MPSSNSRPTAPPRPQVLVIGAGFGGRSVVQALAKAPVDITVLERTNHHLFQPMLYQLATGIVSDGEIAAPVRGMFARQANCETRLADVRGLDLDGRRVRAEAPDGQLMEFAYDYLVVAAGAETNYFGNEEWAEHAPGMKNLEDAHRVRASILGAFEMAADASDPEERRRWLTFVTVGGGPTGVEITGQIAELSHRLLRREFTTIDTASARVVLADGGGSLLAPFPARLQNAAARYLKEAGVETLLGHQVTCVDADGVVLKPKDGEETRISAGTVIWAAGVRGSELGSQIIEQSDAEAGHGGRVTVDPHCAVPGRPEVFVIGDLAALDGVPGVCQPAMQEGRYVAKVISARLQSREVGKPFHYFDKGSLATIGHRKAVANAFGVQLWGLPAQIIWGVIHLYYLVGVGNRMGVAARWAWSVLTGGRRELAMISTAALAAGNGASALGAHQDTPAGREMQRSS